MPTLPLSISEKKKLGEPKDEISNLKIDLNICILVISKYNICNLNICILVILRYNISNLNILRVHISYFRGHKNIAPERAKKTVQLTTQRGVRTCLNPMLAQRFPTNHQMLHYKQLPHMTFTDTLFAGTPSRSRNKCAQAYSASFGWATVHPMTRKGKAHETLSLLFHRVMECRRPWYLMVQKSKPKETLRGNFTRLIAMQDRPNPTPRGSRLLRVVSVN